MERIDPLERAMDLLFTLLDATGPLSLRELVEMVPGYPEGKQAQRQAFERDKRLLRSEGVPIETVLTGEEDQSAYVVDRAAYFLPDLGLSDEERVAVRLALATVRTGPTPIELALAKLGSLPEAGEVVGAAAGTVSVALPSVSDHPALGALHEAIASAALVAFDYRDRRRTVDPIRLWFHRGRWYLRAWDTEAAALRTFRADRIAGPVHAADPGTGGAHREAEPDSGPFRPWTFAEGEEVLVRFEVDAAEAQRVRDELPGDLVAERGDGSVVVETPVTDMGEFAAWIAGFLEHATVTDPAAAVDALVSHLEATAASLERPR